jgi:hypothetical protein
MGSFRFWKVLRVVVTINLALLIAIVFGLGVAIRNSVVDPPAFDLGYTAISITAYSTHYPECPPYTNCPLQSTPSQYKYYVIWSIHDRATTDQPYYRVARRLVVIRLRCE